MTETVDILTATPVTDRYGNTTYDWTSPTRRSVSRVVVAPRRAADSESRELGRQGVIVGLTLYMPPGTSITAYDRVEVRGEVYEVEGEEGDWRSPHTSWRPGIEVAVRKVTG